MENCARERLVRALIGAARSAPVLAAAAAALLVATACAGPPFSAGAISGDAAVDAADAQQAESGPPADAGGDAPAAFCANAGPHDFCEDFDTTGVPGKFLEIAQSTVTVGGPKIGADMTTFVSPPASALASTPVLLRANDQATAVLEATASSSNTQAGARLRLSAEIQVGAGCVASSDGVVVALVKAGAYAVAVQAASTEARLLELKYGGGDGGVQNTVTHPFSTLPTDPKWFELVIDVALKASTATVSIDGATALDSLPLTLSPPSSASSAIVFLGAQVNDSQAISAGCKVHVDNVLFDIL